MVDTVLESEFFPVNSNGEIILQQGVGDNVVAGYIHSSKIPSDYQSGKMVVKLPVESTSYKSILQSNVTDFATALQNANDAIVASGIPGYIELRPENYILSSPVTIDTSFVGIRGNGANIQVNVAAAGQNMMVLTASVSAGENRFPQIREFSDFTLKGPYQTDGSDRDYDVRLIYLNSDVANSSIRVHLNRIRLMQAKTLLAVKSRAYFLRGSKCELLRSKFAIVQDAGATDFAENAFFEGSTFFNSDCFLKDVGGARWKFKACSFDYFGDATGSRVTSDDRAFYIGAGATVDLDDCHVEWSYGKYAGQTNCPIKLTGANSRFYMRRGKLYYFDSAQNPNYTHTIETDNSSQNVFLDTVECDKIGRKSSPTSDDSLVRGSNTDNTTGACARVECTNLSSSGVLNDDIPSVPNYHWAGGALRNGVDDPHVELQFRIATTGTAAIAKVTGTDTGVTPNIAPRNVIGNTLKITGVGRVIISFPIYEPSRRHSWAFFLNAAAAVGTITVKERQTAFAQKFDGTTVTTGNDTRNSYSANTVTVTGAGSNVWNRVSWKDCVGNTQVAPRMIGQVFCIEIDTASMSSGALYLDDVAFDLL